MSEEIKTLIINEEKFKKERSAVVKYLEKLSRKEIEPVEVITALEHLSVIENTNGLPWADIIKILCDRLNPPLFKEGDL